MVSNARIEPSINPYQCSRLTLTERTKPIGVKAEGNLLNTISM